MSLRSFTDVDGARWQVWDTRPVNPDSVSSDRAGGWLTFVRADDLSFSTRRGEAIGTEKRRFAPLPDGWEAVAEERLREWLARAHLVVAPVGR